MEINGMGGHNDNKRDEIKTNLGWSYQSLDRKLEWVFMKQSIEAYLSGNETLELSALISLLEREGIWDEAIKSGGSTIDDGLFRKDNMLPKQIKKPPNQVKLLGEHLRSVN